MVASHYGPDYLSGGCHGSEDTNNAVKALIHNNNHDGVVALGNDNNGDRRTSNIMMAQ